ncbi:MAG: beta-propeller fold lactonase family protein [Vulcanimicrobiota bacterium]
MKLFNIAATFLILTLLLNGCGGGGSSGAPQSGAADLTLSVDFGPRGQVLSQSDQMVESILIEIRSNESGQLVAPSKTLARPAQGTVGTVTFINVPLGTLVVSADFFNAAGEFLGRDSKVVTLAAGQPLAVTLSYSEAVPPDPPPVVTREFVVATNDRELRVFELNPTTGFLTQTFLEDFGPTSLPFSVDIRADGAVYVTVNLVSQVRHFQLNPLDGTLSSRTSLAPPLPEGGELSPDGRFYYHCEPNLGSGGSVRAYRLDENTGAPTEIDASPFDIPGSLRPQRIFIHPNGRWLYVGEKLSSTGFFFIFEIDQLTGSLTFVGSEDTTASTNVFAFAVSPDQNTLYVAGNNQVLDLFSINQVNGTLGLLPTFTANDPLLAEMVVDSERNILYVCGNLNGQIEAYNLDPSGTPTTPLPGSPFSVGSSGTLTLHRSPSGQFLVCGNTGNTGNTAGTVSVLRIQDDGTLTTVPGSPFPAGVGTFDTDVVALPLP